MHNVANGIHEKSLNPVFGKINFEIFTFFEKNSLQRFKHIRLFIVHEHHPNEAVCQDITTLLNRC